MPGSRTSAAASWVSASWSNRNLPRPSRCCWPAIGPAPAQGSAAAAVSVEQAGETVVQLYSRWGKADQAAQWRQEVQAAALGTPGSK